jgi:hypothetical protein
VVLSYSTSLGQQLRGHDFEGDGGEHAEDGALLVVAGGGAGAGGLLRWALGHDVDYQVAFDAGFDFRGVGVKGDLRFGADGGNGFGKVSVRGIGMFCEETASLRHGADSHVWVSIQRWFEREAEDAAPAELGRMFGLGSTRMPSLTGLKTVLSQVVEGQSLMR